MSRLERIVAACGGIVFDNGRRALICGPDHSQKDRSVSLAETEDGRLLIHCFSPRDDWRAVRRALADRGLLDDDAPVSAPATRPIRVPVQPNDESRIARAKRIWDESGPIHRTPATSYLRYRAIPEPMWAAASLRFHPRMTSVDDRQRRPALIAAITDAAGVLQGVQVTLLSAHGAAKACVTTPRRVIGKLMGGSVRLGKDADECTIGEGVETMMSAASALDLPALAALSADNLAGFEPAGRIRRLVVAVDNDAAGYGAYRKLKARLAIKVEMAVPPNDAEDWNAAAMQTNRASSSTPS